MLRVSWTADYDPALVGVYRVKTGPQKLPAVFTKFEAIYARRAFPGFDEPSFKVPFDVSLTVPAASWGLSNMPLAGETPAPNGRKTLRFATTPPLSTYLVAFAVGPFETKETTVAPSALRTNPLPLDVVALKGREREAAYALKESPALLAEEERYFGVAFPYPKLDLDRRARLPVRCDGERRGHHLPRLARSSSTSAPPATGRRTRCAAWSPTRWPTSGSAISPPWTGGTTSG